MKKWRNGAIVLVLVLIAASLFWWRNDTLDLDTLTTTTVQRGTISETVSVSGFIEAENTAELSFPATGRISQVYVEEGDVVDAGTVLATIGQDRLAAERSAALASVEKAKANQTELNNGQTTEERIVTEATVAKARAAWEQTTATELQKVQNALNTLRSNDLIAYTDNSNERSVAPTVTGSYTCDTEGVYRIEVYSASAPSGYAYRLSGLESGSGIVSTDQASSLGNCGLDIQFIDGENYGKSVWEIPVPNTRSNAYVTYVNAYNLAVQQAEQNIRAAKEVLDLAEDTASKDTAAPRVEALVAANATVSAAQAELARIDALLADQSIVAPFAGMITDVTKLPGEIATTDPIITLLAEDAFTLKARIPEIDITKLSVGQRTHTIFDANTTQTLVGSISFINPIATEIDGVAYFETKIELTEQPTWLRAGLNADVEVIIAEKPDALYLPKRFIETTTEGSYVSVVHKGKIERTLVTTDFTGNDGLVEVTNLAVGTTVVAN